MDNKSRSVRKSGATPYCYVLACWAFCPVVGASGWADDEVLSCGFYDFLGDGGEVVDVEDACDLGEEALDEPEVTAGDSCDGGDGFCVGEVVGGEGEPEFVVVVFEHEGEFFGAEGPVLVGETYSGVELWVSGEAFLKSGHADEDDSDSGTVVVVAYLFEGEVLEPVGFVDDDQFCGGTRPVLV